MSDTNEPQGMRCSFCGKNEFEAKHFIVQGDACICDSCVAFINYYITMSIVIEV